MSFEESALDKAMKLQNGLVARAEGRSFEDSDYIELRRFFAQRADLMPKVPSFVRHCSDVSQF